ncbi:MAG: arylamine N-acetyltransferase family protein [Cypionkella sp.]
MRLNDYLERIGLAGPLPATLQTLHDVHRAQAYAVPYEGLDIQLGVPLDLCVERIFDKLVTRRRGGWCYEANGLLFWALREVGFDVQRCTAGVYRREKGDATLGNHLTLIVALEQRWLCDLGLGDGLRAPILLAEGLHEDGALNFQLERLPDGFWRFHNHAYGAPTSFDFRDSPAEEALFYRQNITLQTDPASHFVQNAEVVRMGPDHSLTLLGKVLRHATPKGVTKQVLDTPEALQSALRAYFGINGVDVPEIWPRIEARHRELFGS